MTPRPLFASAATAAKLLDMNPCDPTRDNSHLAHIRCADIPGTKGESRNPLIGWIKPRSLAAAAGNRR